MLARGSLVRLNDVTSPMHGRSGEIVTYDILTDFVTVEFYGVEPYSERKFRVPARRLESAVDAPKDSKPASARPGAEDGAASGVAPAVEATGHLVPSRLEARRERHKAELLAALKQPVPKPAEGKVST